MPENIIPINNMTITEDTIFAEGVFHLPDGIHIAADNITIRGNNTHIIGSNQQNTGIRLNGSSNIVLNDIQVSGYYHGVRADHAKNLTLDNITVRDTQEINNIETFLYLWKPLAESYGGGILLHDVQDSTIRNCDVQHQMNGILLYDCSNITAEQNNGSFNSGWGIYLSNTHNSLIQDNQFDFCNRVFKRENGIVRVEADAAGMVIVKGASHNRFLRNSCLCGGDGIFLCGYEHPGSITPCNDNLFEDNDCRLSPNNAIEATFSGNNIFRGNDCSRSNYGFWMGYSYDCKLEDNHVEFNRWAGIAIEHAYGFTITGNTVANNGEGIRLFTRGGAVTDYFENRRVCSNFVLQNNQIEHNDIGFHGYTGAETGDNFSHNFLLENNIFDNNRVGAKLNRVTDARLFKNEFTANIVAAIQHDNRETLVFDDNLFDANHLDIVTQE